MKPSLLTFSLFVAAAAASAGEPVPLDKNFAFRLDQPALRPLPDAPVPAAPARSETHPNGPLKTPAGETLPPGSRPLQFNGQTYYYIPLGWVPTAGSGS